MLPWIVPAHSPYTTTFTSLYCSFVMCARQRSISAATASASLMPGATSARKPEYQPDTHTSPNPASFAFSSGPVFGNLLPSSKPA